MKAVPISSEQGNEENIFADKVSPFPQTLVKSRKDEPNSKLYETFRKCEKLKGCKKLKVRENVSTVIQRKLPAKCKDPSMFTIPCTIGDTKFEKAMLDLGAPYSMYASLKLGPLVKTGIVIQLADRSNVNSRGVIEDVLVKVNELVFLIDFYVLDMKNDIIDCLVQDVFELNVKDELEVAISNHVEKESGEFTLSPELRETVAALNSLPKLQQIGNDSYAALQPSQSIFDSFKPFFWQFQLSDFQLHPVEPATSLIFIL
ncbi:uncharacterized protein LOC111398250 [Olea europaea var. sylvestris]|uniref:uncharacterized protein LOC111398250 n=1 Tax=Olea europaea var. sylvestris TaxID=158386 RepID=UPI000C1CE58B|nr:uncharacterized protein LOC111398250 [Olea europaea var. sylvestris]